MTVAVAQKESSSTQLGAALNLPGQLIPQNLHGAEFRTDWSGLVFRASLFLQEERMIQCEDHEQKNRVLMIQESLRV